MKGKINVKTIIVLVILVLVVILTVLGIKTVKTYMSGATADMEPKNVQAVLSEDGKSATITWVSDKESMGVVLYGTNMASMLVTAAETTPTTNHSVILKNLRPNATWYYKIQIDGVDFDNNGMPYSFKTKGTDTDVSGDKDVLPGGNKNENTTNNTATPSTKLLTPTIALSKIATSSNTATVSGSTNTGSCNKTTDYNKDGVINSMDYLHCIKNGSGSSSASSSATTTPGATCKRDFDYNSDGVVNTLDYIKCLQTNKI